MGVAMILLIPWYKKKTKQPQTNMFCYHAYGFQSVVHIFIIPDILNPALSACL